MIASRGLGDNSHSDVNALHTRITHLYRCSSVRFAHGQYKVVKWWCRFASSISPCLKDDVDWEQRSENIYSIGPEAGIHFESACMAESLSGLPLGRNQVYPLWSSFIVIKYLSSPSSALPMKKKSMWSTSLGCWPCNAVEKGPGILSPDRETIK